MILFCTQESEEGTDRDLRKAVEQPAHFGISLFRPHRHLRALASAHPQEKYSFDPRVDVSRITGRRFIWPVEPIVAVATAVPGLPPPTPLFNAQNCLGLKTLKNRSCFSTRSPILVFIRTEKFQLLIPGRRIMLRPAPPKEPFTGNAKGSKHRSVESVASQ
jgi:hypothetical protein